MSSKNFALSCSEGRGQPRRVVAGFCLEPGKKKEKHKMITTSTIANRSALAIAFLASVAALTYASLALTSNFGDWGPPINVETIAGTSSEFNTPLNDGCPIQAPDGLSFYIASNRPGTLGGQDI